MRSLELIEERCVTATLGWLELGNPAEANEELRSIAPELQAHPTVLKARWCIYATSQKWEMAVEIARAIRRMKPADSDGWVLEAEALHKMGRTRESWEMLLPAAALFPHVPVIRYLLACYASQLGSLRAAKDWLQQALELDKSPQIKLQALDEPDLAPLWENIPA